MKGAPKGVFFFAANSKLWEFHTKLPQFEHMSVFAKCQNLLNPEVSRRICRVSKLDKPYTFVTLDPSFLRNSHSLSI